MHRRTLLWALTLSMANAADLPLSPEDLVRSFIRDYYAWNNRAVSTLAQPRNATTDERIRQEYQDILRRYCPPGFKGEPLAFSSSSLHDPEKSVIVSVQVQDARARVRVQKPMDFSLKAVHTHEFDLQRRQGRWFLIGIFYIDGRERIPSL